ncbi:hypothetical protein A2686_05125 [Candidatus Woesebacteria bacterium RIFCSPHIGHO2_01_FULL_38_10]|uniref:Amine oxidase domain-containing protein n=1 Tax=Candidatus Woesebacteria bacterium RIFCSPLOWO2_01_FULL_39_10b TaxID=1802517 RepID=A0A1F8B629_9BACT|nr:MAG: hypothetical protein A2686_05125 [Candidatus Woesebacteria bacterium RIFCSPHIGHO2_01_FULL_38_10]OGM59504.1 MAG: hypothetical protein A2892_02565 [Candidatus Woesebacteria bacterium RIFCSPLOWO2_01_FULL_39_10b]
MKRKIIILGGGLAGVEFGKNLKEAGFDFLILEKENKIGGLARTNNTGRYYWDFGVHALYSKDPKTTDYLKSLPLKMNVIKRKVKVFHRGKNGKVYLLDYPFEMGVKDLPLKAKIECVIGYLIASIKPKKKLVTLADWIDRYCGFGIAKHFMIPYNKKIWSCELSQISTELVSIKIEPAPFYEFFLSAFGKTIIGRKSQAEFFYPEQGIQSFIDYLALNIRSHIKLNTSVKNLVKKQDQWVITTEEGKTYEGTDVISTIPVTDLLRKVEVSGLPKSFNTFKWNNTYFVMVGLKKRLKFNYVHDCQWVFFKGDESFYRISMMHAFSPKFPTTLVAEITQNVITEEVRVDVIKQKVIKDLVRLNIIESEDWVESTDIKLIDHTYPIPTLGLNEKKKVISESLGKKKLYLLGRNGNWDYINMDGVINAADDLFSKLFTTK